MENNSEKILTSALSPSFEEIITDEEKEKMAEIEKFLDQKEIEPTTAFNILLESINVSYDKEHFNDLDRALIAKALGCFKEYIDRGEDFTIKVK
jgi:hypothetical protein